MDGSTDRGADPVRQRRPPAVKHLSEPPPRSSPHVPAPTFYDGSIMKLPHRERTAPEQGATSAEPRPANEPSPRPWGARRTTAAIVAALTLLVAGALLFEAVWQRTGHAATTWFDHLTSGLATRPVDDVWVLTGAAITAAAGLTLLVLALTPGLRRRLPLRAPADPDHTMRAVLDRRGAALLLRDAAMRVPGVGTAQIRMRRRRVLVRARARFREPDEVRDELAETIRRESRDRIAFARPPRVRVRVRPAR